MKKILMALLATLPLLLACGQAFGAGPIFKAEITNDSLKTGSRFFTINLYCENNEAILPPPNQNRMTWTSPFAFTGDISIDWLDGALKSDSTYFDSATALRYVTPQFYDFFDIVKVIIHAESWGDGLPDKFSIVGIANVKGYPPELGKIKIASWHAKTSSKTGRFCIEKGKMKDAAYDWVFDEPVPDFVKQCWSIEGDTLKPL